MAAPALRLPPARGPAPPAWRGGPSCCAALPSRWAAPSSSPSKSPAGNGGPGLVAPARGSPLGGQALGLLPDGASSRQPAWPRGLRPLPHRGGAGGGLGPVVPQLGHAILGPKSGSGCRGWNFRARSLLAACCAGVRALPWGPDLGAGRWHGAGCLPAVRRPTCVG